MRNFSAEEIDDLCGKTYAAPWFGRAGLYTRDPVMFVYLGDDRRFFPFGVETLPPVRDLVEWLVMSRTGLSIGGARAFCRTVCPTAECLIRKSTQLTLPGRADASKLPAGSQLEFSYAAGLIRATVYGEVLYERGGRADSTRSDRGRQEWAATAGDQPRC